MILLGPFLTNFVFGILLIFLRNKPLNLVGSMSLIGSLIHLTFSFLLFREVSINGIQVVQLGEWAAPFGITFVADTFSSLMVLITGFIYFMGILYSLCEVKPVYLKNGFYPLIHFLIMGVTGAFTTGDYFNLYVWYEVMILSSFGLLIIGEHRFQLEGTLKYAVLNFLASTLFLMGLGLLYGVVGSLNMADVTQKLMQSKDPGLALGAILFISIGFSIKSAIFPFYNWLPTSYHLPTYTVSAVFAGLLTKVGVYSLFRILGMSYQINKEVIISAFTLLSLLTMLFGVFGAATQFHMRKILGFHIISQIGYMILALSFFTQKAFAAAVFYLIHHIIVKTNLFFISGIVKRVSGSEDLSKTGGMLKTHPWVGFCFIVSGFSLGGIPPLSGFFAKFAILKEGIIQGYYFTVGVALFVGLLTLFSMTKIWSEVFWKAGSDRPKSQEKPWFSMMVVIFIMSLVTLFISINPDQLMVIAERAGQELFNPETYIKAVLKK